MQGKLSSPLCLYLSIHKNKCIYIIHIELPIYNSTYIYIIYTIDILYIYRCVCVYICIYIYIYVCVCLQWIKSNYVYIQLYTYTHIALYIWNSLPPTKSPDFPRALRWFWPLLPSVARGSVPCWRCSTWSVSGHSQRRGWNGWNPGMGDLQWNYMNFCGIWFT